jgi:hypothetical protein
LEKIPSVGNKKTTTKLMKTNYQTLSMKLIFLLTLFVILFQSCSKEPVSTNGTPITKYEYLTAGALNQTPYFTNPDFDTISFASDKGDTLSFVKTKTDTSWYCENQSLASNYKICYQTIHNTYSTIKGIGSFDIKHILKNGNELSFSSNTVAINFNDVFLQMYDDWIGSKTYKTYLDTFNIGSKTYKNSILIYPSNGGSNLGLSYINKEFGLYYLIDNSSNLKLQLIN